MLRKTFGRHLTRIYSRLKSGSKNGILDRTRACWISVEVLIESIWLIHPFTLINVLLPKVGVEFGAIFKKSKSDRMWFVLLSLTYSGEQLARAPTWLLQSPTPLLNRAVRTERKSRKWDCTWQKNSNCWTYIHVSVQEFLHDPFNLVVTSGSFFGFGGLYLPHLPFDEFSIFIQKTVHELALAFQIFSLFFLLLWPMHLYEYRRKRFRHQKLPDLVSIWFFFQLRQR